MAYGTIKVDNLVSTNGTVDLTTITTDEASSSAKGYMSPADKAKLDGIESGATADQTGAEIKAAYEGEADTNAFTDADHTKLDGIEAGAQVNTVTSVNGETGAVTVQGFSGAYADLTGTPTIPTIDPDTVIDANYVATDENFTTADHAKLDGIEAGATGDQTGAEIKAAYEAEADTNAYDDAAVAKLAGIEVGATADQTGAEIKAAYEGEADTNAFTDADQTKLDGIEAGAEVNVVTSVAGKTGSVNLIKADVGLGNVDNTADADKPVSTATQTALDAKADLVGGKLSTSQIPDLAVTEYKGDVADQTAMLAVTGQKGDWVTRQDDGKVYIITGDDPTSASDWAAITYPAAAVQSVAGKTGAVTLAAGDLTDVNTTGVSNGDLLTYNSLNSEFRPVTAQNFASEISAADIYDIEPEWNTTIQHHEVLTWDNNDEVWLNKFVDYADVTNTPTIPTNNNQLTNGAGYITSADGGDADTLDGLEGASYCRSDADDTVSRRITFSECVTDNHDNIATSTANLGAVEIRNEGSNDAFIAFHATGDHAFYFGLDASINDLAVGGWSKGANSYRIWHAGNDGASSGLDADLLDGQHGSYYSDYNNLSNKPSIPTLGNYDNTGLYTFDGSGNFTATGNVTAYSDIRLKSNIEAIPNALEKVAQIRGVTYDRIDIGERQAGVIAQEVEAVLPEVVRDHNGTKSVAYGNLVGLLIEAVKELQSEVEALKAERN